MIFNWTRVKSNLCIPNLHTSNGCNNKNLGSRTEACFTILKEIGLLLNIFSSRVIRNPLASNQNLFKSSSVALSLLRIDKSSCCAPKPICISCFLMWFFTFHMLIFRSSLPSSLHASRISDLIKSPNGSTYKLPKSSYKKGSNSFCDWCVVKYGMRSTAMKPKKFNFATIKGSNTAILTTSKLWHFGCLEWGRDIQGFMILVIKGQISTCLFIPKLNANIKFTLCVTLFRDLLKDTKNQSVLMTWLFKRSLT